MNKRITGFMLCLLMLFFVCCGSDDDPDPDRDIDIRSWFDDNGTDVNGTYVKFINTNAFSVSIYSDNSRQVKISEVQAGSQSDLISVSPNPDGALFYPTYQIIIEGILLPYEGDVIISRIDPLKTTSVSVPSLKELSDREPTKKLTANTYLKIQNIGSSSLVLRKINVELLLDGTNSSILNGDETGLFKITQGPVSDYSLRINTVTPVDFPQSLTEFSAACLYSFRFDGVVITLQSQTALTLAEAGKSTSSAGSEFSPLPLTVNAWANGSVDSDTTGKAVWYSFSVTSGITYYIWWNDSISGNSTKTLDVNVDASYSGGVSIFRSMDSAWLSPQSFKTSSSGTVKLKVYPKNSASVGTFAIAYNTTNTKPAVPVTYTVTFDINGGSGTAPPSQTVNSGTSITMPSGEGLSRSGYTFGGWNTNSAGTGTNYTASYTVTGNITLYAKWNPIYTLTFDANGGSGSLPPPQTGNSGTMPSGEGLSRSGYSFGGWNTRSDGGGTNYNVGASYTLTSSLTLYAKWNQIYTVFFDANDGKGTVLLSQKASSGSITLPDGADLSRTGFIFGGWNTNSSGTGTNYEAGASYSVTNNITLYARWYTNFSSTNALPLEENKWVYGNIITSNVTSYYKFDVTNGDSYYIWWNDYKNGDSTKTMDISVNAFYDSSGAVIFNATDAGWATSQSFTASTTGTVKLRVTNYGSSNNTGTYAIVYGTSSTKPQVPITVKFDANSGSGAPSDQIADYGSSITLPSGDGLSRSNYAFGGWNTNSSGSGTNFSAGSSYTVPSSNITLYAKWNPVYTVTFNANGGSGTVPPEQIANSGSSITLPSGEGLSRTGYVFGGWNTNSSGSGTNYNVGASYSVTGSITFYAKWSPVYTVTFNANGGSGTPPPAQTVFDTITLPGGEGLSRSGYVFGGWNNKADGTGTTYKVGVTYTVSTNVTLYALWYTSTSEASPFMLTLNSWTDGHINIDNSIYAWYSFDVIEGNTYYVWWNDSKSGNSVKTTDIEVSASYNDGSSIFNDIDSAWTTPQSFKASSNGIVKLKVSAFNSGTYSIAYNTSNVRP